MCGHFFVLSVFAVFLTVNGGFILTSPKVLDAGKRMNFSVIVLDAPVGENITFRLVSSEQIIAETNVSVQNDENIRFEMDIPSVPSDTSAEFHALAHFTNGYKIDKRKDVRIRSKVLILVQTDKAIYKPGQRIRFRVLPLDNNLRSLGDNKTGNIWIEDPSGIRIEQWMDVTFSLGLREFELPLSEEPTLGAWRINVEINKASSSQSFRVEKYVLPKFEVTIKAPKVVLTVPEKITVEVCAKYTYGKKVVGELNAMISYRTASLPLSSHEPLTYSSKISGCHEFAVRINRDGWNGFKGVESSYCCAASVISALNITVNVTETGTGIVRNNTAQIAVTRKPLLIDVLGNRYFKKYLPYYGQIQVRNFDGSPAVKENILVCATFKLNENEERKPCKPFTSDDQGAVHFSIAPTSAEKISLTVTANNDTLARFRNSSAGVEYSRTCLECLDYYGVSTHSLISPAEKIGLKTWYSPSGSYIQIENTTGELECGRPQPIKIRYTDQRNVTIKFHYQVLSKGRIIHQGTLEQYNEPVTTDSTEYDFTAENKSIGQFTFSFEPTYTMFPMIRLLVFYLRSDREVVPDSKVFRIKECFQNKVSLRFHPEQQYPKKRVTVSVSASPHSLCGIRMVDKSVRLLEKDTSLDKQKIYELLEKYDIDESDDPLEEVSPCYWHAPNPRGSIKDQLTAAKQYIDGIMAFEEAGTVVLTDLTVKTCFDIQRAMRRFRTKPRRILAKKARWRHRLVGVTSHSKTDKTRKSTEEIRSYFPETWLWELVSSSEVLFTVSRRLPDTITEWVGNAVCVHPDKGLGISDDSSVTAFQPFFVDFQLPYSVIRGEILPLTVSVFSYLSQCLQVKISLEASEKYVLLSKFSFDKVCACGGQMVSSTFLLRPTEIGVINITAYASSAVKEDEVCGNEVTISMRASDAVSKPLLVEAEGFPKEDVFNYLICLEGSNGFYSTDVELLLPENAVKDSSRAYITVTGDVMGPALNGLENLVRLPYGCGEQNMIRFAPNIVVLDYLTATQKLTDEIKHKCIRHMKTGYQRELTYRREDGSYSAFGSRDEEGSLWLTAFVLRCFGQARRFINIDEKNLNQSVAWLVTKQEMNGCFRSLGRVIHKEMKGGLNHGGQSLAPLTAFVLVSLLESGLELQNASLVKGGLKCLESEVDPANYHLALFAYASALAEDTTSSKEYLRRLEERAIVENNLKHWESSSRSKSVSVEIASYYVMTSLQIEHYAGLGKVLPVARWLMQQRNSNGGFVSTQDTVVALQALAKYASYLSRGNKNTVLRIKSDDLEHALTVNDDNQLLTQNIKIPNLPTVVNLTAKGKSCIIVQFSVRYNVEKAPANEAFDLRVDVHRSESSSNPLQELTICMRYKIPNQASNMIVLLVKMPSGFAPHQPYLQELQDDPYVELKRHEVKGNDVNLYFDELTNSEKCFKFYLKSEFGVSDVKPSIIRLYDYYQPEQTVSVEYSVAENNRRNPEIANGSTELPGITSPTAAAPRNTDISFEEATTEIMLNATENKNYANGYKLPLRENNNDFTTDSPSVAYLTNQGLNGTSDVSEVQWDEVMLHRNAPEESLEASVAVNNATEAVNAE